jgi:hypothetical protein
LSAHNLAYMRVAVLWHDTLIAEKIVDSRQPVTIGESKSNTLVVPDLAGIGETHVLFSPEGDGFSLHPTAAMNGRLRLTGGEEQTLADVRKVRGNSITVGGKDWGVVDIDDQLSVFFQLVGKPERFPKAPLWGTLETSILGSLLAAVILHLGFLIAAFLFWSVEPVFTNLDLSDRFMKIIVEEPPPEIEEEEEEESVDEDVGKKAGGEEGKFGEEDKIEKSKVPNRDGELVDKVKDVGIHKALGSDLLGRGPLQSVFGDKTGFDSKLNAAMAGVGDNLVIGQGAGGMGLRGTGSGGGGQGFGRIHGMGRIDTGGGRGTKASLGGKAKRQAKVRVRGGQPGLSGFCKEQDITRVVNARQRGIQYCYEKELARNPELEGKVTLNWRIMLDGKVGTVIIENSTLNNKSVEDCMTRQVKRWSFPKPEGGMCQIKFPFVFNAGL